MGPIRDEHGLEQGGSNSSDEYKSYNNELLITIQNSKQGADLGNNLVVSGLGQADDVALLVNCIFMLLNILILSMEYCSIYNVKLCPDKTKLLLIASNADQQFVPYTT